ncbi:MAG: S-layer homology domain-containing protein [Actinobacteria bacterium]|nr:S-layer homology domain-containing protein [Actinomycetota bacterium]
MKCLSVCVVIFLLIFTVSPAIALSSSQNLLNRPVEYKLSGQIKAIAAGGYNGDGRTDLAVLTDSSLIILVQGTDRKLHSKLIFAVNGRAITSGDINSDGRDDIAVVGADECAVFIQHVDGTFDKLEPIKMGGNDVKIADVNNDGRKDLVITGGYWTSGTSAFLQKADGTLDRNSIEITYYDGDRLDVADVNGDGKAEILIASRGVSSRTWICYRQDDGSYLAEELQLGDWSRMSSVSLAAGDVNSDGVAEILSSDPQGLHVYSQGLINRYDLEPSGYNSFSNPVVADFNSDGLSDVVIMVANMDNWSANNGNLLVFTQGSNRTLSLSQKILGFGAGYLAAGDFNGDGRTDIAMANGSNLYIYTQVNPEPPAKPQGLQAKADSKTITLSWSANTEDDIAGYNIYRSTSSTETGSRINWEPITKTSFVDTHVMQNTTYYYGIKALDTTGSESVASEAVSAKLLFDFRDVNTTDWYFSYIQELASNGIISGFPDSTFKPNNPMTRAEFAKVIIIALGESPGASYKGYFKDVSVGWSSGYVEKAKELGVISGYPDGSFKPTERITRAEISKIIVTASNLSVGTSGGSFSDISTSHWAYRYVLTARNNSIVGGYLDGSFRPEQAVTRAEASKIVCLGKDKLN